MTVKNRLLFMMMPASTKENLTNYYEKKSSMASKTCQTDDYLIYSLLGYNNYTMPIFGHDQ
jgi:hypothetical protein